MYRSGFLHGCLKLRKMVMRVSGCTLLMNPEKKLISYRFSTENSSLSPTLGSGNTCALERLHCNSTFSDNQKFLTACRVPDARQLSEEEKRIWAVERLSKGKWYAGHDRKQHRIPGYIIDNEMPHILILMDKFQIDSLLSRMGERIFLSTVFTLEVFDGFGSQRILYKLPVLPRRMNYSKSGFVENIGFMKAPHGVKIKLDTPIHIIGKEQCIGVKKGGHLRVYSNYVSVVCSAEELPTSVEINVSGMDIGDKVHLRDIHVGLQFHSSNQSSEVICEVV
ncbi:hypothetical protein KP509_20G006700 [Ceratopteris richardii]|uniref:Large ribosomal subunit protein bL25 beta domain-containing protein n=1 Tax=Ceratopteris richardii TaxID=49495 RepID=A0A8T2SFR1_CERRI|nr:hypothetical protein KP509_20G006700 [Ceratopteris richardii]KAH7330886.1 hypothetical protein KP509_20G006700 [Ceratopteris richardii]